MIEFRAVTLEDKQWIKRITDIEDSRSGDCCFTNIFIWDEVFSKRVAQLGDRLIMKLLYQETPFYSFPIGRGELGPAIMELKEDAGFHGVPLRIRGMTKESLTQLEAEFPDQFDISEDRDIFDYVYSLEKMTTLAGKKLHGKRNHINRFVENNDWSFEPITTDTLPQCMEIYRKWAREVDHDVLAETRAMSRVFNHYEELGLEGGILRSGGDVIGFTMGERLNSDTYITHVEKAVSTIQGAYPMINREFSRFIKEKYPDIIYVNREDDMGLENLRKAKHSYYPEFMVEKFTAVWR